MWGIYPSLLRNVGVPIEQRLQSAEAAAIAKAAAIAEGNKDLLSNDANNNSSEEKGVKTTSRKRKPKLDMRTGRRGGGGAELLGYADVICDYAWVGEHSQYVTEKHSVDILAAYLQLFYAPKRSPKHIEDSAKIKLQRVLADFPIDDVIDALTALLRGGGGGGGGAPPPPRWMRECCSGCLSKCLLRRGAVAVVWKQTLLCDMNEDAGNALVLRAARLVATVPTFIRPRKYFSCVCPQLLEFLRWGRSKAEERMFNAALLAATLMYRSDAALVEQFLLAPAVEPFMVCVGRRPLPPGKCVGSAVVFDEQEVELTVVSLRHLLSDSFEAGTLFGPFVAQEAFRAIFDLYVFTARGLSGLKEIAAFVARLCLAKSSRPKELVLSILSAPHPQETLPCHFEHGDKGGVQIVLSCSTANNVVVAPTSPLTPGVPPATDVILSPEDLLGECGITSLNVNSEKDLTALRAEKLLELVEAVDGDGANRSSNNINNRGEQSSLTTSVFFDLIRSLLLHPAINPLQLEFLSLLTQKFGGKCVDADVVEFAGLVQDVLTKATSNSNCNETLLTTALAMLSSIVLSSTPTVLPEQVFLFHSMLPPLERIRREFVVSPELHAAVDALVRAIKDPSPSWVIRPASHTPKHSSGSSELGRVVAELQDSLPAARGGALIRLRGLVMEGEASVTSALPRVLDVFAEQLTSDDNYVYESAIAGLSCLGDLHPELVIPRLAALYANANCNDSNYSKLNQKQKLLSAAVRVKVGEALLQTLLLQGEMLQAWEGPAMSAILCAVADAEEGAVRASALSLLASLVSSLPRAVVERYAVEVAAAAAAVLKTDGETDPRRAAALCLLHLERTLYAESPESALVIHKKEFNELVDALAIASRVDPDDVVRGHCTVALEDLQELTLAPAQN